MCLIIPMYEIANKTAVEVLAWIPVISGYPLIEGNSQ